MTDIRWPEPGSKPQRNAISGWREHGGEIIDQVGKDWTVIHCVQCQFLHVIPIPDEDVLANYYELEFYEKEKPAYIQRYNEDRVWWTMTHRRNIHAAAEFLAKRNGTQPKVLDVGTGPGIFLDTAAMFEWDTWGIEPSRRCARNARRAGHNIFQGTLKEFREDDPPKFDFIHAYEVLEHVPAPLEFLEDISALLQPSGVVGIVVPNDYNTLQLRAEAELNIDVKRWWVTPPQHLNYFTPSALMNLMRKAGFEILEVRGTWAMESFLFAGYNYIGNDQVGRMCHRHRMESELSIEKSGVWALQRNELQKKIQEGIGREMFILGRLAGSSC
jgi:2-polyprenyl-3-methyl-5-hydroxy-6-metoxy-1,4-benzoquinol methylase